MTYRAKLVIPAEEASRIDYLLSQMDGKMQSAVCKASYEVPFPNGYKAKVDLMVDFFSLQRAASAMRREKQSAKPSLRTSCSTPGCSSWMVPAI